MLTLISTIFSFLAGGLPKFLDFLQDRMDKKQEIELARMQIERELQLRKMGFDAQARLEEIRNVQLEMEAVNQQIQCCVARWHKPMGQESTRQCPTRNNLWVLLASGAD